MWRKNFCINYFYLKGENRMIILETKDLKKYYGNGETMVRALDGVNLSVEAGSFTAIVGTSGSGKSTLLHMLGGLDRPTSGEVIVDGEKIFGLKEEALTIFRRRKIGFVFQNYNLVPVLNVYENIVLPIELDGKHPDQKYVKRIVQTLGLENKSTACRVICPEGSSRELRSRGHWLQNRRSCSVTNRPEIWTPRRASM